MKKKYTFKIIFFISILFFLLSFIKDKVKIEDLKKMAAIEVYPNDEFLNKTENKKAIILVAHDDDDCIMSGTISKLKSSGWEIKKLCFEIHKDVKTNFDPSTLICNGSEFLIDDYVYRKDTDSIKKNNKLILSLSEIDSLFLTAKVSDVIIKKVSNFKPSIIFTMDSKKGGYGHCEHVFISRLTENLFNERKLDVERIYQGVYTRHMETEILDKWLGERLVKWGYSNVSLEANRILNISGMSEPNFQIEIYNFAENKMNYLKAYKENVLKNFRKFIPYFEDFDAKTYFKVFDREFFRVIEN